MHRNTIVYPSGRDATSLVHTQTNALIIGATLPNPIIATDAWLAAKEAQTLEDGTSARITPDRAARLHRMRAQHCAWPIVPVKDDTLAAYIDAARPRITAAVQARLGQGGAA